MLKKILGVILILAAAFSFLCCAMSIGEDTFIILFFLIVGLLLLVAGVKLITVKKREKVSAYEAPAPAPEPVPMKTEVTSVKREPVKATLEAKRYTFRVAGISFREADVIDQLLTENDDYSMTKKELIEYGLIDTMIYKYDGLSTDVQIVPEPDNPHDPNALKVIVDGIHIGYVPAKEITTVKRILTAEPLIGCSFHGGEYKILFEDDATGKYEVKKGKNNVGAEITLKYEQ